MSHHHLHKTMCFLLGFTLISIPAFCRQKNPAAGKRKHLDLRVLAKAYGDSIVIRWAPDNATAWNLARKAGFEINRIDYSDPQHPVSTLLTPRPLMPMTLAQMKTHLDHNNKYAAIAAQAMYGNTFRMTKQMPASFAEKIQQAHNAMNFRFAFAMEAADFSAPVAAAMGVRWVDKNVEAGSTYVYIISSTGSNHNYVIDSSAVEITNIKNATPPVPAGLQAYGFDRRVELHWNRLQAGQFSAYYIERSDDRGKTYRLLNKIPFNAPYQQTGGKENKADSLVHRVASVLKYHQVFFDSIPQDYKTYYYRISGLNAFAEQSPWSPPVAVHGVDLTPPPQPVIDSVKNTRGHEMEIHWKQPGPAYDLKGYFIERGSSAEGPFSLITDKLIPKGQTDFIDTAALPHTANYYAIIALDTAGNKSVSFPHVGYLTDTTAPAAPTDVTGVIDSNGVVHLHWKKNTEPDIKGYKIYDAYNPDDLFSQVTHEPVPEAHFTDTIPMNSLNRKIYYKVVAVDQSNNHSGYSAMAVLKKPVVVPPTPPAAGNISIRNNRVHIQWIESKSIGAAGYGIYRREAGKMWQPIAKINQDRGISSFEFIDSSARPNTDYQYAAETIDSTGIHSEKSFPVHVRVNDESTLPAINNLKAALNEKQDAIMLTWNYSGNGDYYFVIYRAKEGATLSPWHAYDKNIQACKDHPVKNGIYQYAIKIVHRDNILESGLSKSIKINVPEKGR